MSELHKFLFDGLPVRGAIVRLTDAWTEILARRQANNMTGAWPPPVADMMGEMAAGLIIYWTWSNLIGIVQQWFIMRKVNGPKKAQA